MPYRPHKTLTPGRLQFTFEMLEDHVVEHGGNGISCKDIAEGLRDKGIGITLNQEWRLRSMLDKLVDEKKLGKRVGGLAMTGSHYTSYYPPSSESDSKHSPQLP